MYVFISIIAFSRRFVNKHRTKRRTKIVPQNPGNSGNSVFDTKKRLPKTDSRPEKAKDRTRGSFRSGKRRVRPFFFFFFLFSFHWQLWQLAPLRYRSFKTR